MRPISPGFHELWSDIKQRLYIQLALEPSAAQVPHSKQRCIPALERFYRETKLSLLKSTQSFGSPEFPNQILRQIGPGVSELWSDKQTDRPTYKQRLQLNIYRYIYKYLDIYIYVYLYIWLVMIVLIVYDRRLVLCPNHK